MTSVEKKDQFYKVVEFVYLGVMNFIETDTVKGLIVSSKFLSNVDCLIHGKIVIHHSRITGDVIGYAHSFCKLR